MECGSKLTRCGIPTRDLTPSYSTCRDLNQENVVIPCRGTTPFPGIICAAPNEKTKLPRDHKRRGSIFDNIAFMLFQKIESFRKTRVESYCGSHRAIKQVPLILTDRRVKPAILKKVTGLATFSLDTDPRSDEADGLGQWAEWRG